MSYCTVCIIQEHSLQSYLYSALAKIVENGYCIVIIICTNALHIPFMSFSKYCIPFLEGWTCLRSHQVLCCVGEWQQPAAAAASRVATIPLWHDHKALIHLPLHTLKHLWIFVCVCMYVCSLSLCFLYSNMISSNCPSAQGRLTVNDHWGTKARQSE